MPENTASSSDSAHSQPITAYAQVNGIRMYYEIHGSGNPIVLIHGGGSTITTSFKTLLPILAHTRRVIAVELQSHGRTSNRKEAESFQQDADDVAELLKQLGIEKADILGFSNGGQTALEFSLRHPAHLNKLVLLSMFYKRSGPAPQFWEFMSKGTFADMPQVYKDEFLKVNNKPEALQEMYLNDASRMQNFKDWQDEDLQKLSAPTLIVMGDQDVARVEHAVEMHRLIKNSRLLIVPGNHGSYFGEAMSWNSNSKVPDAFAGFLNEFLDQ